MGGRVTYLVEFDGPISSPWRFREHDGAPVLTDHPLRQPWAKVGGPAADLDWVRSIVAVDETRSARQGRTWNLSAIWSIPTLIDGAESQVWLKCVPDFFSHEAAVLRIMADTSIPRLVTHDGHRILLEPMAGYDGYDPSEDEERAMIDALVDLQLASVSRVDELLAAGVPDFRTPAMIAELRALVERLAQGDSVLQPFVDGLEQRLALVDAQGLPAVLAHGDPHGGNCRLGVDPPIWFDWGDSLIGNPLLDVAALHRFGEPAVDHWLNRWAEAVPGSRPHEVWELLKPVGQLRMAWVYQRFCDNIEPSEQVYHQDDVEDSLNTARMSLAT